ALPEPGQQFIANGDGAVGQIVDRDAVAHHFHPGAAVRQLRRGTGDVDGNKVHRDATHDRHRIVADETDRARLHGLDAERAQTAVGIAAADGGNARRARDAVDGAVADGGPGV